MNACGARLGSQTNDALFELLLQVPVRHQVRELVDHAHNPRHRPALALHPGGQIIHAGPLEQLVAFLHLRDQALELIERVAFRRVQQSFLMPEEPRAGQFMKREALRIH